MGFCLNKENMILVASPHPDDESIGCGGILSLYKGQCDVLLATDGYREDLDNRAASERRVDEFLKATEFLGVHERIMMHIPEHRIKEHYSDFLKIDFSKYRYVLVPNRYEIHSDHVDLYNMVKRVLRKQSAKAELLEYEVWTTLRNPNIKIDISPVVDSKRKAIEMHSSQIEDLDYVGMIIGLNAYRGKGHGCDYAEVFFSSDEQKRKRKKELKRKIKSLIKQ